VWGTLTSRTALLGYLQFVVGFPFSVIAPTVWNSVPDDLRDPAGEHFRQHMKTDLFTRHYAVLAH